MADAAARREARRKRILENSHNRLQLISGKSGDDCFKGSSNTTIFPTEIVSELDDEIPSPSDNHSHSWTCPNNGSIVTILESLESLSSTYHQNSLTSGEEVTSDTSHLVSPASNVKEPQTSFLEKLLIYKYDIILLSLLIQLFYSVIPFEVETYFFLPVVMYSMTKMIWFPQNSDSGISNALRLMNHFSSSRVQRMIEIAQYIGALLSDVCVFVFATIWVQFVYITLNDSLLI